MRKVLIWLAAIAVVLVAGFFIARSYLLSADFADEPELAGTLEKFSLDHAGEMRTGFVYIPSTLAPRADVVLVLHGSDGDGARARVTTAYEFDSLAEEHGFLAVYPDGYERHWNGCRKAGPYAANEQNIDDVGFLTALMANLAERYGATGNRYVTGVSNGGHMAMRMALEAPGEVTAVAPIIASMPAPDNFACTKSGTPVAILVVNGTDDPMNPFEGGTVSLYGMGNRGEVLSTIDTVDYWRELAGHEGAPENMIYDDMDGDGRSPALNVWRSPGLPPVGILTVEGGGHSVPHPDHRYPRILGPTNHDISGPREIWRFFERSNER